MDALIVQSEIMVSQNAIPSKQHLGGALPYAFTEQGVYIFAAVLNQAVKGNIKRSPSDFMFQLSQEEYENWRSQTVTSSSRLRFLK